MGRSCIAIDCHYWQSVRVQGFMYMTRAVRNIVADLFIYIDRCDFFFFVVVL